jgi:hypothetical protein
MKVNSKENRLMRAVVKLIPFIGLNVQKSEMREEFYGLTAESQYHILGTAYLS